MLNKTCSNSTASTFTMGRSGSRRTVTRCRENFSGALQSRTDDLPEVVRRKVRDDRPRFEPGHVEQIGDEAVEPFRFLDDGGEQVGLGVIIERFVEIPNRAG